MKAHRVAWELYGDAKIPTGINVCHKCDNPPCCNPAHLFLGTQKDNMIDRSIKNRVAHILSDSDVSEIRRLYMYKDMTQKEISLKFGICSGTVSDIVRGKRRKNSAYTANPKCRPRTKISYDQKIEIKKLRTEGLMQKEIAARYGIDPSQISRILADKKGDI